MQSSELEILKTTLQQHWHYAPSPKAQGYVGKFFELTRTGTKISAKVVGNHGTYTVSIAVQDEHVTSACSCYIGKHGGCHHCHALAITFLQAPKSFKKITTKKRDAITSLDDVNRYVKGVTLETLLKELKQQGITQKAFAESIGMNSRHLGSIKNSELRNRFYNELGATKLACLWVLEHIRT